MKILGPVVFDEARRALRTVVIHDQHLTLRRGSVKNLEERASL